MISARLHFAALVVAALALPTSGLAAVGLHDGAGSQPVGVAASLTPAEVARLQYLREEEKLAHDVYATLYERWGMVVFARVSGSEQDHTDAVRHLLERYGVADPSAGAPRGRFVSAELQRLHDSLLSMGLASSAAALAVGVLVEETDITDLQEAMALTAKTELLDVFGVLLQASTQHLAAFTEWSGT